MAGPFDITAPSSGIRLDENRKGEVAFTVFNNSGRRMRARAQIVPDAAVAQGWLTLVREGEEVQDFNISAAHQYVVKIAVPSGVEAGQYTFHLEVIGENNPDEEFTAGPRVTFEVRETIPKKTKPFPWWAVAAEVIAIIVIAVSVFLLLPKSVEVPPTANLSVPEAAQVLREAGLTVNLTVAVESSDSVQTGNVIRTDPAAGESVGKKAEVTLVVSGGS